MKWNIIKISSIALLLILYPYFSRAQTETVTDLVEKTAESMDAEGDYSALVTDLDDLARHPVRLNNAKEQELDLIPFLAPGQRKALSDYLTAYGEVLSLAELRSVPGFDSTLVLRIAPFISVEPSHRIPPPTPGNLLRYGHHDLLLRVEESFPASEAYGGIEPDTIATVNTRYPGNPQRYYFRYTYQWFDRVQVGLAGEKDPGEQFFRGSQRYGMDYYAGYLAFRNTGILQTLVIGNFRAAFGQGLTFRSGFSLGTVPGIPVNCTAATGVRPAMGMNEGSYLRGAAVTIRAKALEMSGFVSYHARDATVSGDTLADGQPEFSSFVTTGYHRTPAELARKNNVKELLAGGNMNITCAPSERFGFKAGVTAIYSGYSIPMAPSGGLYRKYRFGGSGNFVAGADCQVRFRRQFFHGEISRSRNGGVAWLAGAVITPDPAVTLQVIYRDYHTDFQNEYSSGFGQNSLNAGERGIYLSGAASPGAKITLAGFLDLFSFTWLKYRVDRPSTGVESGILVTWKVQNTVTAGFKFSQKNSLINDPTSGANVLHRPGEQSTRGYRFTLGWDPSDRFALGTRFEVKEARTTAGHSYGYLICQDFRLKPGKVLESAVIRWILFDIPAYDARVWTVDPEVLYGYTVTANQGKGIRGFCVVRIAPARMLALWLRAAVTFYTDRSSVGSGPDTSPGNLRGEASVQVLVKL